MKEIKDYDDFKRLKKGDIFVSIPKQSNSDNTTRISKVLYRRGLIISRMVKDEDSDWENEVSGEDWNFIGWVFYKIEDEKELENIDNLKLVLFNL
jgi:hypothetical protein